MTSMKVKQGWQKKSLKELSTYIARGISPKYDEISGIVVINQRCIRNNKVDYDCSRLHNLEKKKVSSDKFLQPFDILVNSTGVGTLGRVAQIKSIESKTTVDSHVTIVRPDKNKITPAYLGYALIGEQSLIEKMGTGATGQTELSRIRLGEEIEVVFPTNIDTQNKISSILFAFDELIQNNSKRIALLENSALLIYKEWFSDHKPSKNWKIQPLSELTELISRGIAPKYDEDGKSLVINQRCIRNNQIDISIARRNSKNISENKQIRFGDVLINSTGVGTLGRVAQVYENYLDCTVDSHVSIVRPNDDIDVNFFGICLIGLEEVFQSLGTGSTGQTELSRKSIGDIKVVVPPKDVQQKFGDTVAPLREQVIALKKSNKKLRQTRKLLLPTLVSGEVEVANLTIKSDYAA